MIKSLSIVRIVIWGLVIILLTAVLISSIVNGGRLLDFITQDWPDYGGEYEIVSDYTIASADIDSLSVSWKSGDITLLPTNEADIRIVEEANFEPSEDEKLQYEIKDGLLKIKQGQNLLRFSIFSFGSRSTRVSVYLPEKEYDDLLIKCTSGQISLSDLQFLDIELEATSGQIDFDNIQADQLKAHATSGQILGSGVVCDTVDCYTTSGKIELQGTLSNITANCTSGNIEIETDVRPENLQAEVTSGKLAVLIPENDGFEITYAVTSGKFDSDFELNSKFGNDNKRGTAVYKNGGPSYSLVVTSGTMYLEYAD